MRHHTRPRLLALLAAVCIAAGVGACEETPTRASVPRAPASFSVTDTVPTDPTPQGATTQGDTTNRGGGGIIGGT